MLFRATDSHVQTIASAIQCRCKIEVNYGGGSRLLEPHAVGIGQQGQYLLRAFQVSGYSRAGQAAGWKLFRVDEMSEVLRLEDRFAQPRAKYVRGDRHMLRILAQV